MALLEILLPPACAGCGAYGRLFCEACHRLLQPLSRGQDHFSAPDAGMVLGDALLLAHAAFAHAGPMRRALQRLKYGGAARLANPLARAAAPALLHLLDVAGPAVLVPVPVHPARLRQRGYNQAALLAGALAAEARLPLSDLLIRTRATTRQHGLTRAARLHNLRGAFAVRRGRRIPDSVILIDDILTTAATLESCAVVLRSAGVTSVFGLAIAREV